MPVEEGSTMDEDTTTAMAHMAVTLHEEYGFTDACATGMDPGYRRRMVRERRVSSRVVKGKG